MQRVNAIIIERSYLIRSGLVNLLNEFDEIHVIRQFSSIDDALSFLETSKVNLIFMNIDQYKELKSQNSWINSNTDERKFVLINQSPNSDKNESEDVLHIYDEKNTLILKLEEIIQTFEKPNQLKKETVISKREETILRFIALGFTNKEIADKLYLSAHTVITHRKNITKKLGIRTVSGLTIYAILNKIISIDDVN